MCSWFLFVSLLGVATAQRCVYWEKDSSVNLCVARGCDATEKKDFEKSLRDKSSPFFGTQEQCEQIMIADHSGVVCAPGNKGAYDCAKNNDLPEPPPGITTEAPKLAKCKSDEFCLSYMAYPFGGSVCCNKQANEAWKKFQSGSICPRGKKPVNVNEKQLLGRDCSVSFCPSNSKCVKTRFYAVCCPN